MEGERVGGGEVGRKGVWFPIWDLGYRTSYTYMQITSNGKVVGKDRCLLLFNNMILCAAMKRRKKKGLGRDRTAELESSTGSR